MICVDVSIKLGVTSGWKTPVNLSLPNKMNTPIILNSDILQKLLHYYQQEHPNTKHYSHICMWWHSWLRHCATRQKVAGSIPEGAIGIFH